MEAIKWAVTTTDDGIALALRKSLPDCILQEQLRVYKARPDNPEKSPTSEIYVNAQLVESRQEVGRAFRKVLGPK